MKNECLRLFLAFLKIGAFTFGGGYAMIPLITEEAVNKNNWISDDDMLEVVAIAESTPGPIAVNSATFVGYKVAGVKGALCATLGVILPSFVIISLISLVLEAFNEFKPVRYAFMGIKAGVLALIVKAFIQMFKKNEKSLFSYFIMVMAFILMTFLPINAIFIILFAAIAGIIMFFA